MINKQNFYCFLLSLLLGGTCWATNNKQQSLYWTTCSKKNLVCQVTYITVPLDYSNPYGKTIKLAVERLPALDQQHKIGTLFFNSGGPWNNQIESLNSVISLPQYQYLFGKLHKYFDLVAFNPRGVSPEFSCKNTEAQKLMGEMLQMDLGTETGIKQYLKSQALLTSLCNTQYNQGLLPYLGTDNTARDLDTIRQALNIDKLNYLADSYGTVLGIQYLILYPQHVRAMVLDGNENPDYTWTNDPERLARATERGLENFFTECAKTSECAIHNNPKEIYMQVLEKARANPIPSSAKVNNQKLTAGMLLNTFNGYAGLSMPAYKIDNSGYDAMTMWSYLARGLYQAFYQNDSTMLVELFDAFYQYDPQTKTSALDMSLTRGVTCLDFRDRLSDKEVLQESKQLNQQYPLAGGAFSNFLDTTLCSGWPVKENPLIQLKTTSSYPAVLLVGNIYDPNTSYSWSQAIAERLPNTSLLTWMGNGHTAISNESGSCIKDYELNYLSNLKLPPRGTVCNDIPDPFSKPQE